MAARVSQETTEAAVRSTPAARVTQETVEAAAVANAAARASQVLVEGAATADNLARVSQVVLEAVQDALPHIRASQIFIEILIQNVEFILPQVYPKLPGKKPAVDWDTDFANLETARAASGAEIDIGISLYPLHTFKLSYEFLRDWFGFQEQRLLRGFFGAMSGNLTRFLYRNPDDFEIKGQLLGTADGTTRHFTIVRTYGVGDASWTEPVGYVDQTNPVVVYLDSVRQDHLSYVLDTTDPVAQAIIFNSAPALNQVVSIDCQYFYYCKFADPKISLSRFMEKLFSGDDIVLRSCRPGA